jgi:hypothetical protein
VRIKSHPSGGLELTRGTKNLQVAPSASAMSSDLKNRHNPCRNPVRKTIITPTYHPAGARPLAPNFAAWAPPGEWGGLAMTTPDQPGWFDDPNDPNALRYWDGQVWTPHRERKPAARPAPRPVAPMPPPRHSPATLPPPSPPLVGQAQSPPPPLPPPMTPGGQAPLQPPSPMAPLRSRAPLAIVAAIVVVVVLAVAGVFGYRYFIAGGSDEDQIRALVADFTTDFNNADGAAIANLICGGGKKAPGIAGAFVAAYTSETLRSQLDQHGTASTSVSNIHVTGEKATAQVITTYSKLPNSPVTETESFAKENGTWKVCDAS